MLEGPTNSYQQQNEIVSNSSFRVVTLTRKMSVCVCIATLLSKTALMARLVVSGTSLPPVNTK